MPDFAVLALETKLAGIADIDAFEWALYTADVVAAKAFDEPADALCEQLLHSIKQQLNCDSSNLHVYCINDAGCQLESEDYASVIAVADLADALQRARLLDADDLAVIVGVETQAIQSGQKALMSFAADFECYQNNQAAAALAITPWHAKHELDESIYASIDAFDCDAQLTQACYQTLQKAQLDAEHIEQVEVIADSEDAESEVSALLTAYQSSKPLTASVSSVKTVFGDCGNVNALLALIKSILSVQQRFIAGTKDWQNVADERFHGSPFYFASQSTVWHTKETQAKRYASMSAKTGDEFLHLIVADNPNDSVRNNGFLKHSPWTLLLLSGNNKKALQTQLTKLQKQLADTDLKTLAQSCYQDYLSKPAVYRLSLLADSIDALDKEIELAKQGVAEAFENKSEWKTPKGSYFTASPVGADANDGNNIAFLYPGIGATYVGLAKDVFQLFPQIYQPAFELADNFAESIKDRTLHPRSVNRLNFKELKQLDSLLRNHLPDIAECGVAFACVFTFIFQKVFNIQAGFSTGYSMGEVSMYAALGCWQKPAQMRQRLMDSEAFNHGLTGELQTLRQHWDLPPAKPGFIEKLWETYSLKATVEQVQEASVNEDRVYCTIVNTPDSLVIGGDPEACQRVIKRLGTKAMAMDMPNAIHSPPAFKEYEHMEKLYTMDVTERIDTKMYSSSCYLPVPQRTKAIANSIAKCLCDPVDFPRLVHAMHDKGAQVFIEMGPGRSLSSWVEKILKKDQAHLSLPVNAKGTKDEITFLRSLAKLLSHGVKADVDHLYYGSLIINKTVDKS